MTSYLLYVTVVVMTCTPLVTSLEPVPAPRGCVVGGRVISPGSRFSPHPCTRCRCPRKGGLPICTAEDCRHDGHCLRHDNVTAARLRASCCRPCLEPGCRHTDGHVYKPGEVISIDGCSRCYCPLEGGAPTCDVKPCGPIMCVDYILKPGQCCPVCPRGHNCQLGLAIIPRGRVVTSGGALCRCRLTRKGHNHKLESKCRHPNAAKMAALLSRLKGGRAD